MIISYSQNFIFIKTRKTAGTSMEVALATTARDKDVATPFGTREELARWRTSPHALARNFSTDNELERAYTEALKKEDKRGMNLAMDAMKHGKKFVLHRHGGAKGARQAVGEKFWNAAFKFTVERHPYEKVVSFAWYRMQWYQGDFNEAMNDVFQRENYRNFDLYSIDGKPVVDFLIRYEHLRDDIRTVEERLGISILEHMPRANSTQRKDRRPAREILTEVQKEQIYSTCRKEFELVGYER